MDLKIEVINKEIYYKVSNKISIYTKYTIKTYTLSNFSRNRELRYESPKRIFLFKRNFHYRFKKVKGVYL